MKPMQERVHIDFDVRFDTPLVKDPDSYSPTSAAITGFFVANLFQDLVTPDKKQVSFFTVFDDFGSNGKIHDSESYGEFRRRYEQFLLARKERIRQRLECAPTFC